MQPTEVPYPGAFSSVAEEVGVALWQNRRGRGGVTPSPGALRPTNLPFLDPMLGGGLEPERVYALLGMTGVCKTTFAVQLACSMALRCYSNWLSNECRASLGRVYLFSLEENEASIRSRAIAFSAQVPSS